MNIMSNEENDEKKENNETFDFGELFQKKVIANLFFDEMFLQDNHKILKPIYFDNYKYHWIVDYTLSHYQKYSSAPTIDSFFIYLKNDDSLEEQQKESIVKFLALTFNKKSYRLKLLKNREQIQKTVSTFCWQKNMVNALYDASKLARKGEYERILPTIEVASNEGKEVSRAVDFDDVEQRAEEEFRKNIIPMPWDALNKRIGGGIGSGEFATLIGGMGSGKSLIASSMGLHARSQGYTAVIYSLELSKSYFRHRTDVILTKTPAEELSNLKKKSKKEYSDFMRSYISKLPDGGRLLIQELPFGSTASDIRNDLKWLIAQGIDPNLFIIDYLDRMHPIEGKNKRQDWQVFEDVTNECRDFIAKELNLSGIGMVQGNTQSLDNETMKAGSTSGGARRLHPADIVLGYARNTQAKNESRATLSIIKNRFGIDGVSLPAVTDYSIGQIDILDEEFYLSGEKEDNKNDAEIHNDIVRKFAEFEETQNLKEVDATEL